MRNILLSRDQFREGVFSRDRHKCVFCYQPAVDAHHIIDRRLWADGGYYLNNGASVCTDHHIKCETTEISIEQVREACGIQCVFVPSHMYDDQPYDKWGNPILPNGQRVRGELFFEESVQKILAKGGVLDLFTHWVKYPRTYHLPYSENVNADDRVIESLAGFIGKRVIVTEKKDGENTTMYRDYFHARSIDSKSHPSRSWAKQFWSSICYDIPEQWRVCCENLYAQHSIAYDNLPSFVMGFSIWNERNVCLDWDTTQEWFELLGVHSVPVWYDGIFNEQLIRDLWKHKNRKDCEGYVVRVADEIAYSDFRNKVAKFVRKDHVQTDKHWMHGQPIIPNKLAVGV